MRLHALVVGNSAYKHADVLSNPVNDANEIGRLLTDVGFSVSKLLDADCATIDRELNTFVAAATDADVVLFFFAGHGLQIDGANFLLGIDTPLTDASSAKYASVPLDLIIEKFETTQATTKIFILDACRNNPWTASGRGFARGLATVYAPRGSLIAYATSPGEIACDGAGRNGAYTSALLAHLETADIPIELMFKNVRNTLNAATSGRQTSWEHTSLAGEFYFNLSAAARIEEYPATAIMDRAFVLDPTKKSHAVIAALKSHNWYTQNPALNDLTVDHLKKMKPENLFVLGRNILQAADGSSDSARWWIVNFATKTAGLSLAKAKALLDGMLFETYFNSGGDLRATPKIRCLNELFDLATVPDYKPSFEFIASCLSPHASKFFTLPGKGKSVTASVRLGTENEVESIIVSGREVLGHDDYFDPAIDDVTCIERGVASFENFLAKEMHLPARLLTVVYTKPKKEVKVVKTPFSMAIVQPS